MNLNYVVYDYCPINDLTETELIVMILTNPTKIEILFNLQSPITTFTKKKLLI